MDHPITPESRTEEGNGAVYEVREYTIGESRADIE
jgi:hypothetical protein